MKRSAYEQITIGQLLRKTRKERGLTIRQVADITKISTKYLQAIEDSNYVIFPSEVFLIGFIKNYASHIGIPKQRALALYRRERDTESQAQESLDTNNFKRASWQITLTPNRILAGFFLIGVIIIIVYLGSYVTTLFQSPSLKLTSPIKLNQGETAEFVSEQEIITLSGTHTIGTKLRINNKEYNFLDSEDFRVELPLNEGLNDFDISSESEFGQKSEMSLSVAYEKAKPSPTPSFLEEKSEFISGQVKVNKTEAYFEVRINDELINAQIKSRDEVVKFKDAKKAELFIPDTSAVTVTINGQEFALTSSRFLLEIDNGDLIITDL